MTPFLKAMHHHAAKRGDGFRTEFLMHFARLPISQFDGTLRPTPSTSKPDRTCWPNNASMKSNED